MKKLLKGEAASVLQGLLGAFGSPMGLYGLDGELILGRCPVEPSSAFPVVVENRILGWVRGSGGIRSTAGLIGFLTEKELEKRALAEETLHKYKEINLLYRMGRRISSRLNLPEVAALVLDEARKTIRATGGSVMLLNEDKGVLDIVVGMGKEYDRKPALGPGTGIAGHVLVSRCPEIVNRAAEDPRYRPGAACIESLMCAPLISNDRVIGVINLSHREPVEYTAADLSLLTALASQAATAIENALLHERRLQQERIRGNLERYVGRQVVDLIMGAGGELSLVSENRHIAILFSDIRDFSGTCERLEAEAVVGYLNTYFTAMVEEIFRSRGTVNKFVGDMIVALFGAPMWMEDSEKAAVHAAVHMQQRIQTLEEPWIQEHFRTGMGISAGSVVVGNIGSPSHMDYTAIGDEVNVASRLQAAARGDQILVSRHVYESAADTFEFRPVGSIRVKGRQAPVETYEVLYEAEP